MSEIKIRYYVKLKNGNYICSISTTDVEVFDQMRNDNPFVIIPRFAINKDEIQYIEIKVLSDGLLVDESDL
jgi:hypothetical protein